jgi:hypothetical protein
MGRGMGMEWKNGKTVTGRVWKVFFGRKALGLGELASWVE